jgi:hypothetical protein
LSVLFGAGAVAGEGAAAGPAGADELELPLVASVVLAPSLLSAALDSVEASDEPSELFGA